MLGGLALLGRRNGCFNARAPRGSGDHAKARFGAAGIGRAGEVPWGKSKTAGTAPCFTKALEFLDGDVHAILTELAQRNFQPSLEDERPRTCEVIARGLEKRPVGTAGDGEDRPLKGI